MWDGQVQILGQYCFYSLHFGHLERNVSGAANVNCLGAVCFSSDMKFSGRAATGGRSRYTYRQDILDSA